jgi:nucleotide-binding universal stress UspA family protein
MKILIGYDGSESADAAIATAGKLLAGSDAETIVVSIWEPAFVRAMHAARFGGPMFAMLTVASDDDDRAEQQARKLAEHGARLARNSGLDVTPLWMADEHDIPSAILDEASELDVDLVVLGARGLAGIRAYLGSVSNHVLQHSRRPVLVIPANSSASQNKANPKQPTDVGDPPTIQERSPMASPMRQKADVLKALKRAGFSRKTIARLRSELPDEVNLDSQSPLLNRYGVTRDELTSRMGGSP